VARENGRPQAPAILLKEGLAIPLTTLGSENVRKIATVKNELLRLPNRCLPEIRSSEKRPKPETMALTVKWELSRLKAGRDR
jgi:hypothetical protein